MLFVAHYILAEPHAANTGEAGAARLNKRNHRRAAMHRAHFVEVIIIWRDDYRDALASIKG